MKAFANVGKAALTKALGLQKNYSEVIESSNEVIDIVASGCETCKWNIIKSVTRADEALYNECQSACASCPSRCMTKEYTYRRVYHNEKNRYGYQPRLKTNAIKLFIAYHFLNVDNIGFIQNVNLQELATKLGCDIKTINNNNELLREYGYISYVKTDSCIANIFLTDYENYFKPASQGGRGFIVMSDIVLDELIKIESINELRITLRQLMEFDLLSNRNIDNIEKSYKELKRVLPDYCKRNIIKKASEKLSLFVVEMKENLIKFCIKEEYNAKLQKEEQQSYYEQELQAFAKGFLHDVVEINTSIADYKESKYADFFEGVEPDMGTYKTWMITMQEIADLASLCIQYSWHHVIIALQSIYKTYKMKGVAIKNLGGLCRTIILATV